jgi:ankyrin repeat protein
MDIIEAIKTGDDNRVRALIGADPSRARATDENGVSVIMLARYHGRKELVDVLRNAADGLDVFEAAALGDAKRLRELLEVEPQVANSYSPDGFTPLQLASFFGQPDAVDVLLEHGADVGAVAKNPIRVQALHSAVAAPDTGVDEATVARIAMALVGAGADVNARQHGGFTPLHAAAMNGHADVAQLLLARGADAGAADDSGTTAADRAGEPGHIELADSLRAQ